MQTRNSIDLVLCFSDNLVNGGPDYSKIAFLTLTCFQDFSPPIRVAANNRTLQKYYSDTSAALRQTQSLEVGRDPEEATPPEETLDLSKWQQTPFYSSYTPITYLAICSNLAIGGAISLIDTVSTLAVSEARTLLTATLNYSIDAWRCLEPDFY